MSVYLIHISKKLHYIGFAKKVGERIQEHQETLCVPPEEGESGWRRVKGIGAKMLGVMNYRGIQWFVSRVWVGAGRDFERRLKNWKKSRDFCPACIGSIAYNRARIEVIEDDMADYLDLKATERGAQ